MLELLYKLFIGHVHKYEIIDQQVSHLYDNSSEVPYGIRKMYTSKCTVCGKIKADYIKY